MFGVLIELEILKLDKEYVSHNENTNLKIIQKDKIYIFLNTEKSKKISDNKKKNSNIKNKPKDILRIF